MGLAGDIFKAAIWCADMATRYNWMESAVNCVGDGFGTLGEGIIVNADDAKKAKQILEKDGVHCYAVDRRYDGVGMISVDDIKRAEAILRQHRIIK